MKNTSAASAQMFQIKLITPEPPVSETRLIAESPRTAYYRVSIYYLPGAGYRIEKASGATGSKGCRENFWRPNLRSALEKKAKLVDAKTRKTKGRMYQVVATTGLREDEEE